MPSRFSLEALLAGEDPPFLVILGRLVPPETLDPWLVRRVVQDSQASVKHRLWLLQQVAGIPEDLAEQVWGPVLQALREEKGGEMVLRLLERVWGFAGVQRLVEELWNEPEVLGRVGRYLVRQEELGKLQAWAGSYGLRMPKPTPGSCPGWRPFWPA